MDYDLRLSYGLHGGVGFGVVVSPFEFHVNAQIKWGWGSFWKPDYTSPYYYRFGYPLDGGVRRRRGPPRSGRRRHLRCLLPVHPPLRTHPFPASETGPEDDRRRNAT